MPATRLAGRWIYANVVDIHPSWRVGAGCYNFGHRENAEDHEGAPSEAEPLLLEHLPSTRCTADRSADSQHAVLVAAGERRGAGGGVPVSLGAGSAQVELIRAFVSLSFRL